MKLSDDKIELLRKKISGWARQSRYRAKKNGCQVDLPLKAIVKVYEAYGHECAYCGQAADSPDHPFPIKDHAPCICANVLPCCDECRNKKRGHNILWMYKNEYITKDQLVKLMVDMKSREGKDLLIEYLKSLVPSN